MGRIPEETIEQILAATDIVDLIGSYFPLKRAGSLFKANCPFHNEKSPSFTINPAWQSYKCFGCGESGSAIGFVMEYENLTFLDAVKKLAQRAGVTIIEDAYDPEADRKRRRISRIKELNNQTARFYHKLLMKSPDAQHARDYLKSRGFTRETAEKWLIGWAPRNSNLFFQFAKDKEFTGREILQAGLGGLRDKENPRSGLWAKFYDQLTFPISNDYGDVVGFSARVLRADDKRGKYINTNDTPLFDKSKLLFGLDKARKAMGRQKFAIIVEGQIDAIVLHENGFENSIAPLGTAFTEQHARMLKRYTDRIVLCYDGDTAGLAAADKAFSQLTAAGLPVKLMHLPEGDDPDTFIKAHGADAFREIMENAKDFFDAKLDKELPGINLASASERAILLQDLAKLVAEMSDDLVRDATIQNLSTRLRLGADDFRQAVVTAKTEKRRFPDRGKNDEALVEKVQPSPIDHTIAYLCHLALGSKEASDYLCEQLEALHDTLDETPGGHLLRLILARRPDPKSPAARLAFLSTLSQPDQQALIQSFTDEPPSKPLLAAEETVTLLLSSYFQKKESALRAQLADPNLPVEQMIPLMQEVKELQSFLSNLDSRFIR
ncbi:DNA primase [Akkermansiaceae bacterium]|nr:DNA primase [Akkermansiaceae bacterium]